MGTRHKKVHIRKGITSRGYITQKGTHPMSNYIEGKRQKQKTQKLITWRAYTTGKGTYPESDYMERVHDTKKYTPKE